MSEIEFDKLIDSNFEEFIKDNELADKSLIEFLSGAESYGKKNLANYQQYLKDTGKATSTFANYTKKAGSVLKTFGAAFGSMFISWAIGKVIDVFYI